MTTTTIPGMCSQHLYITDDIRAMRTDAGARRHVLAMTAETLATAMHGYTPGSGATIHVAVTVEPARSLRNDPDASETDGGGKA